MSLLYVRTPLASPRGPRGLLCTYKPNLGEEGELSSSPFLVFSSASSSLTAEKEEEKEVEEEEKLEEVEGAGARCRARRKLPTLSTIVMGARKRRWERDVSR